MVQVDGAERPRVAGVLPKAADICAIVYLVGSQDHIHRILILGRLTASSADSMAGRLGSAITMSFKAWSNACEKSKGLWRSPSASSLLCDRISSRLTVSLRCPRRSINMILDRYPSLGSSGCRNSVARRMRSRTASSRSCGPSMVFGDICVPLQMLEAVNGEL